MTWKVRLHDDFQKEFLALEESVQEEILARMKKLVDYGPRLPRPIAGTLKGSRHANLKELRFNAAGGVWRVAYAFDPEREAILLAAGSKAGMSQRLFYKQLISQADVRFERHVKELQQRRS
jgi:hypothetical protein